MKVRAKKTTQLNKPKKPKQPLAPQTPDTNQPGLGAPTPKPLQKKIRDRKRVI